VADGCGEEDTAGGLTRFGIDVVKEVARLGIILDLSHISAASFWSALKYADSPIIVSHANCHGLRPHPRNLRDDQIRAIAQTGGLVGMTFYGPFLSDGEPNIGHVADHVEYAMRLVGPDHVAIGPDYMDHNEGLQMTGAAMFPGLYPPGPPVQYPPGLSTFAETPNLTSELLNRGHAEADIRKILGGNYLRVFEAVLKA
jgi:membrane dipeptidase